MLCDRRRDPWVVILLLVLAPVLLPTLASRVDLSSRALGAGSPAPKRSASPDRPMQSGSLDYRLEATWPLTARGFEPEDVALAPDGRLFVADIERRRVEVFAEDGRYVDRWSAPLHPVEGGPMFPQRLAVDPTGVEVYVIWSAARNNIGEPYLEVRNPDGRVLHPPRGLGLPLSDIDATRPGVLMLISEGWLIEIDPANLARLSQHNAGSPARKATRLAALPGGGAAVLIRDGGDTHLTRYDDEATVTARQTFTEDIGVDLATGFDGSLRVLFAPSRLPAQRPEEERVVLRDYAPDGGLWRSWLRRDLPEVHLPADGPRPEPWSLDVSDAGFALSSVASNMPRDYGVLRYDAGGGLLQAHRSWRGIGSDSGYERLPGEWSAPSLSLAWTEAGLYVLDGRGWQAELQRFSTDGRVTTVATGLPQTGSDLAAAADGSLVAASPEDGLVYLTASGNQSALATDCDCDLGARVAVGRGASEAAIFVSRPVSSTIALVDRQLDSLLGRFRLPDAAGLWPADLAVLSEGDLLAADTASGEVQRWSPAGRLSIGWKEPPGSGLLRMATARLADGRDLVVGLRASGEVVLRESDGGLIAALTLSEELGLAGPVEDLALDDQGRIYLVDPAAETVYVLAPEATIPGPEPTSTARPTDAASCQVERDKVAGPRRVVLGETAQVTLTLQTRCQHAGEYNGADVVVAVERSVYDSSRGGCFRLGDDPPVELMTAEVAARLLRRLDYRHHRVGLRYGGGQDVLERPIGSPVTELLSTLDDGTNRGWRLQELDRFLADADRMLVEQARPDALPAIVLMTTACSALGDEAAAERVLEQARLIRNRGVLIFVVQVESDATRGDPDRLLREVAGSPERYTLAERTTDGDRIAIEINRLITELAGSSLAGNLLIQDRMSADVQLLPGSARPEALEGPDWLSWRRGLLPSTGLTMTYQILPLRTGILPTNALAEAHFTDVDGSPRTVVFPVPEIEVVAPTETPTPTATPRPPGPPTTGPSRVYLPMLFKQACLPDARRLDVALVVDRSQSMLDPTRDGRSKLEAAREAVAAFVDLLDMRGDGSADRAALVAFDAEAELMARFTGDAAAIRRGLGRLESRSGTRVDLGLDSAHAELTRIGASARRERVLVLLTDGRVDPNLVPRVEASARRIRSDEIRLITIGLGQDVDAPLLARIASSAEDYLLAPDGEDLAGIYRRLAQRIACQP